MGIEFFALAGVAAAVFHLRSRWEQRPTDECRGNVWNWLIGREQCRHG